MSNPKMTFREAVEIVQTRWTNSAEFKRWERARAIVDAGTAFIEADGKCVPGNVHDPRDAFALQHNREEARKKLRALERGEEIQ